MRLFYVIPFFIILLVHKASCQGSLLEELYKGFIGQRGATTEGLLAVGIPGFQVLKLRMLASQLLLQATYDIEVSCLLNFNTQPYLRLRNWLVLCRDIAKSSACMNCMNTLLLRIDISFQVLWAS